MIGNTFLQGVGVGLELGFWHTMFVSYCCSYPPKNYRDRIVERVDPR